MFSFDRHLFLFSHGHIHINPFRDFNRIIFKVLNVRGQIDVVRVIVKVAARLLIVEYQLHAIVRFAAELSKGEGVRRTVLTFRDHRNEAILFLIQVNAVVELI